MKHDSLADLRATVDSMVETQAQIENRRTWKQRYERLVMRLRQRVKRFRAAGDLVDHELQQGLVDNSPEQRAVVFTYGFIAVEDEALLAEEMADDRDAPTEPKMPAARLVK